MCLCNGYLGPRSSVPLHDMSRALRSLLLLLIALCVLHCAASAPEELDTQGFQNLNSERDEVFNHVVQTLQEVTAQGEALERKLKATQTKLEETAESLAACLADKAKQTPAKDTVTKTVYNECVQQSETARKDYDKAKKELKQLKVELETAQKAAKDATVCDTKTAAVDPQCASDLARLRQDYHKLEQEYNVVKASLANAQKRLDNPDAFASACVTTPLAAAAAAAATASASGVGVLSGSEAVNFWGGLAAVVAMILLYLGLQNSKRRY